MTIIRFIGYSIGWILAPLAIPFLLIAYILLTIGLATYQMWLKAKRDPRHDPYWFIC